jgi:hypothetical protein
MADSKLCLNLVTTARRFSICGRYARVSAMRLSAEYRDRFPNGSAAAQCGKAPRFRVDSPIPEATPQQGGAAPNS